ncbi:MAG TPA: alpha/beta hydrolase [Chlamydiales bacterium]|nr:alpha/beta hydrolase [Chlamydiales bacterium]
MIKTLNWFAIPIFACFYSIAFSDEMAKYVKISDDVTLFYQEKGVGDPLIFIPGWCMSSEIFKAQIEFFSQNYRVIALDPRSQGRSSLTLENNQYTQHGEDFAKVLDHLQLQNVTVVAWSWGCYDLYAYLRLKGVNQLKKVVFIDASPKCTGKKEDWAFAESSAWGVILFQPIMYRRLKFTKEWLQSMVDKKLSQEELDLLASYALRTPTYAAVEMAVDAVYADYTKEAELLDEKKIPTLNLVSNAFAKVASQWLQVHAPHAQVAVMGEKHLAFWEYPDKVNQILEHFLKGTVETKSF